MVSADNVPSIPLIDCPDTDCAGLARRFDMLDMLVRPTTLEDFLSASASTRPYAIVVATSDAEAVRRIRRTTAAPLIVLDYAPARGAAVELLNSGADDYIAAPCAHDEVAARITAVLRRVRQWPVAVHDLQFDPSARIVRRAGRSVVLTPTESAIVCALAERRGQIVSRQELARLAAAHGARLSEKSVPVAVHNVRNKIDASSDEPLIHSIPSSGYLLGRYREGLPPARVTARRRSQR